MVVHQRNPSKNDDHDHRGRLISAIISASFVNMVLEKHSQSQSQSQSLSRKNSTLVRSPSHVSIAVADDLQTSSCIDPITLTSITKERSLESLTHLGGVDHLALTLATNKSALGVSGRDLDLKRRKLVYGSNTLPRKSFVNFIIEAFEGLPTITQLLFAIISLGFGLMLFGKRHGWYDGVGFFISLFLTLSFSTIINFNYSQVLHQLSYKIGNIQVVRALRDGCYQHISIFDVVVGDVLFLKVGDRIPADGLFLDADAKQKGHVVAIIDDGTNHTPALDKADVRLSMGTDCGQPSITEGSDILVLDGNFSAIVTILRWGRCVFNNIQKVTQVQLTIAAVGFIFSLIVATTCGSIPLLWVNMMVDTLAALALAAEQPSKNDDLMKKPPLRESERGVIVTKVIWRNIIGQTLYQAAVLLTLQFKGKSIFGVNDSVRNTLILNCFVLCQVFNECNARKLEKNNIFEGILANKLFFGIVGITMVIQVVLVQLLNDFANTERLNAGQWAACICIAVCCWPVGWLVKCIPVPGSGI